MFVVRVLAFTLSLGAATASLAQSAPVSRTVPVTFTGVVSNDVTNEIRIRQPDGSYAPFNGPVPDYPYKKGDAVTLSFNATLPTKAFYEPGGPYRGQVAADGIYRIQLGSTPYVTPGPGGVGVSAGVDVSGPIGPASNFGQPNNSRMTIVYDSKADSYSIDFANGGYAGGQFAGPGYTYDSRTGTLANCAGPSCSPVAEDNNLFSIGSGGSSDTLRTTPIGIFGTAGQTNDPASGNRAGLFSLLFSGSWNLPSWSGGGATQVPEPGMMFLFGGGAMALIQSRRRKRARPEN